MKIVMVVAGAIIAAGVFTHATVARAQVTEFQYAAKFVCGTTTQQELVQPGQYRTSVNIHNPATRAVDIRFKTALADVGASGKISGFGFATVDPDGARSFDCGTILKLLNLNLTILGEGFFVIESAAQLDVTAVYTAGNSATQVASVDVEPIAKRDIPGRQCVRNYSADLRSAGFWTTGSGAIAASVPPSAIPIWDSTRGWISNDAGGIGASNQDYTYRLKFCSCSTSGGRVTGGDVKTDNGAKGEFQSAAGASQSLFSTGYVSPPSANHNGNWWPAGSAFGPSTPVNLSTTPFPVYGNGWIQVTIGNDNGPVGMSFSAAARLVLDYGYGGECTD
jgi:hypothetical protein